ncbi:MAG: PTS fructose transporter subunit IIA [Candidatus Omnitrophica bacterium CG11_big_fil_rev_8_21_14_0_20_45_26]|uniref:PTS fructose transporter subunit IIA n=1 Tax=Candidatus Abzuiibacterium crystallinum TaxID=1974748 RepID=A0A2H0LL85_9BACT|nr:MAG: PTS fructose transporter subunit IIA [Candidatus Omnitrophica bacterium CG11_big_fil_rev_8_21_14_0_20_45_26]PIW65414.1 MAG: PTS fructose transporter subunit IIA [Candidatus Omnitrophica bacterium CG12_big_fil_rev_8_21_14_0_65_45_16]
MQILVRDLIKIFQVEEKKIRAWISKKSMPCMKVNDQYRFNYVELLEWALENRITLTPEILALGEHKPNGSCLFADALKAGGVYYDVPGGSREEVLKNVIEFLPFPAEMNKSSLLEMFLARESLESTAIGNGIALPHLRSPVVLNVDAPWVSLCFLKNAVDFKALDRKTVSVLFVLVSPSTKAHLLILSRLSYCLQDSGFQKYLKTKASKEQMVAEAIVVESRLALHRKASGKASHKQGP